MKIQVFSAMATIVVFAAIAPANSAEEAQQANAAAQAMMSVNYLLGTWNCAHTVGTFSGKYVTTYSKALGDRWLRQIWDFPAGNAGNSNEGPVSAEALMGYDGRRQAWVRFFANSLGQHFEIRMTDTPDGWSFKYASFFPRTKPETPGPDAVFTKKSDTEYTIDGPTYPEGTTEVTEHHICRKIRVADEAEICHATRLERILGRAEDFACR